MHASVMLFAGGYRSGQGPCSTGFIYMSRWMMGSCVGRHLLVVGVGRQIGVFCLWMCGGASRWVFWV